MLTRKLNWLILLLACCASGLAHKSLAANPTVVMQTSHGNIVLELFSEQSPVTVTNFLSYVDKGFYDNTIFHRVISNFMIQGGGFTADMQEKPTDESIVNESKNRLHNERGTVAMARTNDPDSATAQFFINVRMNIPLDFRMGEAGYTVFGKVIEGMDVVDDIAIQETHPFAGQQDVPKQPIIIKSIRRVEDATANASQTQSQSE